MEICLFVDTMWHVLGSGRLAGTEIGYNPYSAMPSLHVAWVIIVGASLVLLARSPIVRAVGAIYPGIIVLVVIITANHYLLDAAGALLVVCLAAMLATFVEWWSFVIPASGHVLLFAKRASDHGQANIRSRC